MEKQRGITKGKQRVADQGLLFRIKNRSQRVGNDPFAIKNDPPGIKNESQRFINGPPDRKNDPFSVIN